MYYIATARTDADDLGAERRVPGPAERSVALAPQPWPDVAAGAK